MFFTEEDYQKIYDYLKRNSVKDSEFISASKLDGNELISIVQNGKNVKTTLSRFLSSFRTSNFINVTEVGNPTVEKYTLDEAIRAIEEPSRVGGCIITFISKDSNNWEVYQFLGKDKDTWYDLEYWRNILEKTEEKFKGFYESEDVLYNNIKNPEIGDYAFVGTSLGEAVVYKCRTRFVWSATNNKATEYLTIILKGNVTIGENGNWFENGTDTGIQAKGDKGDKPYLRFNDSTGNIEYSFDEINWEVLINKDNITGSAATIEIGDVETLPAGSNAQIINSGTKESAVFNFKIPQGFKGSKGDKGDGWSVDEFCDTIEDLPEIEGKKIGYTCIVGTVEPYSIYINNGKEFKNIGTLNEIKSGVFDGGRSDSVYGGSRTIDCGTSEV